MERKRFAIGLFMKFLLMLTVPDMIHSLSYPIFMTKRFGQSGSTYLPAFISMPFKATDRFSEHEVPDEDNYSYLTESEDYDGYRYIPVHGYAEDRSGPLFDFEQDTWEDSKSEEANYPYGQETWFESENSDPSRDIILARTLSDSETDRNFVPYVYGKSVEFSPDDEDGFNRKWSYGIPVMEEREKTVNEDESVRELESLRRQIKSEEYHVPEKSGRKIENEEKNIFNEKEIENLRNLHFDKQINRSSRKNNISAGKETKINRKRAFASESENAKSDLFPKYNSVKGSGATENEKGVSDEKVKAQSTTMLPSTQNPNISKFGQKEFVLPRPANPVRKPFQRSMKNSSVYETIKKLLAMEKGFKTKDIPRIQKRFVLSGDELASQLSGLKKTVP